MIVTKHARHRIIERCRVKENTVDRLAQLAYIKGITYSRTKGELKSWILRKLPIGYFVDDIKIYGDKAYIFKGECLITVLEIPRCIVKGMKNYIIPESNKYKIRRKKNIEPTKFNVIYHISNDIIDYHRDLSQVDKVIETKETFKFKFKNGTYSCLYPKSAYTYNKREILVSK